jgi:hypothetical protein
MTGRGFEINTRGVEEMTRELQREFDKHPIRVPVTAGLPDLPDIVGGSVAIYNGPVIMGNADGAQLAWNSQSVSQSQDGQRWQVDERYTELAQVTADEILAPVRPASAEPRRHFLTNMSQATFRRQVI